MLSHCRTSCENAAFNLEQRSPIMSQSSTETAALRKWMCVVCGYIYDEAVGVPDEGIAAGTRWEDVPDTWTCPDCGTTKDDFEMIEID
jgi:Rubredoxin